MELLPGDAAIVAANHREQLVAAAPHRFHQIGHGEGHVALLQFAHVGHEVHGHHLGREGPVARHDLNLAAGPGDDLGGLQAGMIAGIVIDQHVAARLHVAADDVPGGDDEVAALTQRFNAGQATGRHSDGVRRLGRHHVHGGPAVVADTDTLRLALREAPVDDAHHLAAARALRGQQDLSARLWRGLEHDDLVAALGCHARGLEPGGTSTNHNDLL